MKREDRYIVIKRIDLEAAQAAGHVGNIEIAALNYIETCVDRMRFEREKQPPSKATGPNMSTCGSLSAFASRMQKSPPKPFRA